MAEPSLRPQALETVHPSRKDLFFQGQPTTLGALQILIGLLHISGGVILAAAPILWSFPPPTGTCWPAECWVSHSKMANSPGNFPAQGFYREMERPQVLQGHESSCSLTTTASYTTPRVKVSTGTNLVSLLAAILGICAFVVELTAGSTYTQVPQKSLLVLLLLSSVLELGITSLTTFLGFQATFGYMWPARSPRDKTGAPSPCPQSLDGYLDSAEDVPVALGAPPESPAQQVQQPPVTA